MPACPAIDAARHAAARCDLEGVGIVGCAVQRREALERQRCPARLQRALPGAGDLPQRIRSRSVQNVCPATGKRIDAGELHRGATTGDCAGTAAVGLPIKHARAMRDRQRGQSAALHRYLWCSTAAEAAKVNRDGAGPRAGFSDGDGRDARKIAHRQHGAGVRSIDHLHTLHQLCLRVRLHGLLHHLDQHVVALHVLVDRGELGRECVGVQQHPRLERIEDQA